MQINARISQKAMIRELTRENERLKAALGATHRQHGIYVTPEQFEEYEEQRVRSTARLPAVHPTVQPRIRPDTPYHAERHAGVCVQGMCMDAMRTLQEQEHRTRRLLAALDEHQHLVGVYQSSEEALAQHCGALQEQLAALHADRAEIHASLLVRAPPSPVHAASVAHACLRPGASACWCTRDT